MLLRIFALINIFFGPGMAGLGLVLPCADALAASSGNLGQTYRAKANSALNSEMKEAGRDFAKAKEELARAGEAFSEAGKDFQAGASLFQTANAGEWAAGSQAGADIEGTQVFQGNSAQGYIGTYRDPANGDIVTSVIAPKRPVQNQQNYPIIVEPQVTPGTGNGWSGNFGNSGWSGGNWGNGNRFPPAGIGGGSGNSFLPGLRPPSPPGPVFPPWQKPPYPGQSIPGQNIPGQGTPGQNPWPNPGWPPSAGWQPNLPPGSGWQPNPSWQPNPGWQPIWRPDAGWRPPSWPRPPLIPGGPVPIQPRQGSY